MERLLNKQNNLMPSQGQMLEAQASLAIKEAKNSDKLVDQLESLEAETKKGLLSTSGNGLNSNVIELVDLLKQSAPFFNPANDSSFGGPASDRAAPIGPATPGNAELVGRTFGEKFFEYDDTKLIGKFLKNRAEKNTYIKQQQDLDPLADRGTLGQTYDKIMKTSNEQQDVEKQIGSLKSQGYSEEQIDQMGLTGRQRELADYRASIDNRVGNAEPVAPLGRSSGPSLDPSRTAGGEEQAGEEFRLFEEQNEVLKQINMDTELTFGAVHKGLIDKNGGGLLTTSIEILDQLKKMESLGGGGGPGIDIDLPNGKSGPKGGKAANAGKAAASAGLMGKAKALGANALRFGAGVLSSPLALGAMVVGGVAYAGKKGMDEKAEWNSFREREAAGEKISQEESVRYNELEQMFNPDGEIPPLPKKEKAAAPAPAPTATAPAPAPAPTATAPAPAPAPTATAPAPAPTATAPAPAPAPTATAPAPAPAPAPTAAVPVAVRTPTASEYTSQTTSAVPGQTTTTGSGMMIAGEPVGEKLTPKQTAIIKLSTSMGNTYPPDIMEKYARAQEEATVARPITGAPTTYIEARADGGPVSGSKAYVVGEEGPEVFVPDEDGQVVPNYKVDSQVLQQGNGAQSFNSSVAGVSTESGPFQGIIQQASNAEKQNLVYSDRGSFDSTMVMMKEIESMKQEMMMARNAPQPSVVNSPTNTNITQTSNYAVPSPPRNSESTARSYFKQRYL